MYRVIVYHDIDEFMEQVSAAMRDGWKPTGGIAIDVETYEVNGEKVRDINYYQAMRR